METDDLNNKSRDLHDENGKFKKNHKKVGGKKKGYSQIRDVLLEELYPFYRNMGDLISQIENPYDRVKAVALISKHVIPTQASVSFTDQTPRNLTAEQELAKLNAKFEGLPEPVIADESDEEE